MTVVAALDRIITGRTRLPTTTTTTITTLDAIRTAALYLFIGTPSNQQGKITGVPGIILGREYIYQIIPEVFHARPTAYFVWSAVLSVLVKLFTRAACRFFFWFLVTRRNVQ